MQFAIMTLNDKPCDVVLFSKEIWKKIPFKSIIVQVLSFSNYTEHFLSINLANYNVAILCLPHISNKAKKCPKCLIKLY